MLKIRILIYQNVPCLDVQKYLSQNNFIVHIAKDRLELINNLTKQDYDFCILDSEPNNPSKHSLISEVKRLNKRVGIVFLTALASLDQITEGFELGADEYIVKPFNIHELMCRLKAINRRLGPLKRIVLNEYNIGRFKFKVAERLLIFDNESELVAARLSERKTRLLQMLCSYMGELVPRSDFLKTIWGEDNYYNSRTMDVYIVHLRKLLSRDPDVIIENIQRQGYRLLIKE